MLEKLQGKMSAINWSKQLFLLAFSFFNVHIYMVQHNQINGKLDYAILLFNILALTAILSMVWKAAVILWKSAGIKVVDEHQENVSDKKYFLITWGVQLLCWMPVFLAFYPGTFNYDVRTQIPQAFGSYNLHHPLAHTLYLQFFYYIVGGEIFHNYNTGIAISTIVQMMFLAASLSYMHLFLRRLAINRSIRLLIVFLFSVVPLSSLMAISTTKDIIFAGNVLLSMTALGYWARLPECCFCRNYKGVFIVSVAGTIIFRNNGIYAVAVLLLVALAIYWKKRANYRFIAYILIGFVLGTAMLMGLRFGLQAKPGSTNEMLSVPYQQMARIYKYKQSSLTQNEKEKIKAILPKVEKYYDSISDPVKFSGKAYKDRPDFIMTYIGLVAEYPGSSVTAFNLLNAGYLSITDMSVNTFWGSGFIPTYVHDGLGVKRDSFIKPLETLYTKLFSKKDKCYGNVIGLNILCSMALYFWATVLLILKATKEKQRELLPMLAFLGMFLLTLLAGPCALPRYALPYIVALPVLWGCVVTNISADKSK